MERPSRRRSVAELGPLVLFAALGASMGGTKCALERLLHQPQGVRGSIEQMSKIVEKPPVTLDSLPAGASLLHTPIEVPLVSDKGNLLGRETFVITYGPSGFALGLRDGRAFHVANTVSIPPVTPFLAADCVSDVTMGPDKNSITIFNNHPCFKDFYFVIQTHSIGPALHAVQKSTEDSVEPTFEFDVYHKTKGHILKSVQPITFILEPGSKSQEISQGPVPTEP